MKALKAAIAAGADACYLAGNSFGARAFAGNFTDTELLEALEYAHLFGVRLYLTVNTLIKDNEFKRLYDFLCPLYEAGLDSVLVQDLGVLKFIRENFPELPIHSSTQMNILTPEGASFVKSLGVKRIVAAREMTLKELKAIKDTSDVELEAFVHGAMCVCYSGRCLMSSMLGGRSGNRGCCAQPCRKLYNGSYRLSMRDMCTLRYVPDLIEAGVDSFKIEGRMKNEYYVASAVDSYKRMIEDYASGCFTVEKAFAEEKRLLDVFNRGGFTSGYLMNERDAVRDEARREKLIDSSMPGRRGVPVGKVLGINKGRISFKAETDIGKGDELLIDIKEPISLTCGSDIKKGALADIPSPDTKRISKGAGIYRTRSKSLTGELESMISSGRKLDIDMSCRLRKGEELSIKLSPSKCDKSSQGTFVTFLGDVVEGALSRPLTKDVIESKLTRIGTDGDFNVAGFECEMDDDIFVPVSALKAIRREALDKLKSKITGSYRRDPVGRKEPDSVKTLDMPDNTSNTSGGNVYSYDSELHVSLTSPSQIDEARKIAGEEGRNIDFIYFDYSGFDKDGAVLRETFPESRLIISLPYVNRGDYSAYDIMVNDIEEGTADGVYIRCLDDLAGILRFFRNEGSAGRVITVILAGSVYAYNTFATSFYKEMFDDYDVELYLEAPYELSRSQVDAIMYPKGVKLVRPVYGRMPLMVTDALSDSEGNLRDDRGAVYPVVYSGLSKYNVIYSADTLKIKDERIRIRKYDLTTELRDVSYTTGHYEKGI